MEEIICNLHIHTHYSDGTGDYSRVGYEAIKSGVDVAIITDHNVWVKGLEGYIEKDGRRVLLLTGEEVHNQDRIPQKSHTLVIGCEEEVSPFAYDPQTLIDKINEKRGLSFLAHPYEFALPLFHETDITWEDWEVEGFTGIELWNGFSEFKTVVHNLAQAIYHSFQPERIPHQPLPRMLEKWDELLAAGHRVVAVAGSDAHALDYHLGIFHKTIFPYHYHFSTINNHLLLPEPLNGEINHDKALIFKALQTGSSFIGFDLPATSRGFSFSAENGERIAGMGEELYLNPGATLRIKLPRVAELRLIQNGQLLIENPATDHLVKTIDQPGAYRVEAYMDYRGSRRGWIFSNPIYIRTAPRTSLSG